MELEIKGLILLKKKYVVLCLNLMAYVMINALEELKQIMKIKFVNILIVLPIIIIMSKMIV